MLVHKLYGHACSYNYSCGLNAMLGLLYIYTRVDTQWVCWPQTLVTGVQPLSIQRGCECRGCRISYIVKGYPSLPIEVFMILALRNTSIYGLVHTIVTRACIQEAVHMINVNMWLCIAVRIGYSILLPVMSLPSRYSYNVKWNLDLTLSTSCYHTLHVDSYTGTQL